MAVTANDKGVAFQAKIASTGTAVQLSSNQLSSGGVFTANPNNTAAITIGFSSALTNTADGTGNGAALAAGASLPTGINNTNKIWINGTAGDWVSFIGD